MDTAERDMIQQSKTEYSSERQHMQVQCTLQRDKICTCISETEVCRVRQNITDRDRIQVRKIAHIEIRQDKAKRDIKQLKTAG